MIEEQAKMPDYEQPKLLTTDINEKMDGLKREISYLINKAKYFRPKPKKKPESEKVKTNKTKTEEKEEKETKDDQEKETKNEEAIHCCGVCSTWCLCQQRPNC